MTKKEHQYVYSRNIWLEKGLEHTVKNGDFPEGWDPRDELLKIIPPKATVMDIGCGYGRLCGKFDSDKYHGHDINLEVIELAKKLNPAYSFSLYNPELYIMSSDWVLFYNVLLYVCDDDIHNFLRVSTYNTDNVTIAETIGRLNRKPEDPFIFYRDSPDYDKFMRTLQFRRVNVIKKACYNDTCLFSFLIYERN